MQINKILVPFDFSEHSEKAPRWAVGIAEKWQAKVLLFHVVSAPTYPMMTGAFYDTAQLEASLQNDADQKIKEVAAKEKTFIVGCPALAQTVDSMLGAILLDSIPDFASYPSWSSAFLAGCLGNPTWAASLGGPPCLRTQDARPWGRSTHAPGHRVGQGAQARGFSSLPVSLPLAV